MPRPRRGPRRTGGAITASAFVISRPDGTERRVSGYRYASPPDAKRFLASSSHVSRLPPKVDLRPFMTPVENQGGSNSCVANAVAGAYEYLVERHRGDDAYDVSRLFIYFNARRRSGIEHEDEGSMIADAIDSLRAADADGEITDEEIQEIAGYLEQTFEQLGSSYDPVKVLKSCLRSMGDEQLLHESVVLFAEHLPKTALASILSILQEVIGVDGLAEEEESY